MHLPVQHDSLRSVAVLNVKKIPPIAPDQVDMYFLLESIEEMRKKMNLLWQLNNS